MVALGLNHRPPYSRVQAIAITVKQLQRSNWGWKAAFAKGEGPEQKRWERSVQVEGMSGHTSSTGLGKQNEAQLDLTGALTASGNQRGDKP